jgi:hypothetical protein
VAGSFTLESRTMTRQSLLLAILILILPVGLAAQVWTDPFNYGGTVLGTWVEYGGDWTGWSGMAKSEETWLDAQWLVQPTRSYQDCVLQCVVKANSASTIQNWGIAVGGGRKIPLWPDNLFVVTINNALPGIFKNFSGSLDASGDATLTIQIPNVGVLSGPVFYLAFITYDATGILEISQDMRTTVVSCTNQTGRPGRVHRSIFCMRRIRSAEVLICGISSARV